MEYQELNFHKMPKFLTWHRVQFPEADNDLFVKEKWCRAHPSKGRFYRRQNHQKPPGAPWERYTDWYFENEDDALLFALKFT